MRRYLGYLVFAMTMFVAGVGSVWAQGSVEMKGGSVHKCAVAGGNGTDLNGVIVKEEGGLWVPYDVRTNEVVKCGACGAEARKFSNQAEAPSGNNPQLDCSNSWGRWDTTSIATCIETGSRTRKATMTDDTQTESIDRLTTRWSAWVVEKEATCKEEGLERRTDLNNCAEPQTRPIAKTECNCPKFASTECEWDRYVIAVRNWNKIYNREGSAPVKGLLSGAGAGLDHYNALVAEYEAANVCGSEANGKRAFFKLEDRGMHPISAWTDRFEWAIEEALKQMGWTKNDAAFGGWHYLGEGNCGQEEEEHICDGEKKTTKEPTCTEEGTWEKECDDKDCKKLIDDGTIPATGHNKEKILKNPATCDEGGNTGGYKCTNEGCDHNTDEPTDALGCACGEWVEWTEVQGNKVVKVRTQYCTRCKKECESNRTEEVMSSVALGNLGFHCNNANGNGRVWISNYFGSIETFIREGNTTLWNLVSYDEDGKVKVAANGGFETPFVCHVCGRTDWISFSNNNGVFNGNNIQLQHSSRLVYSEGDIRSTNSSKIQIAHEGIVNGNSTKIDIVAPKGKVEVKIFSSTRSLVLNESANANGKFSIKWDVKGLERGASYTIEVTAGDETSRSLIGLKK